MIDTGQITWAQVRSRFETEIEARRTALVEAPIERVPMLQAETRALLAVKAWFEAGAREQATVIDSDIPY